MGWRFFRNMFFTFVICAFVYSIVAGMCSLQTPDDSPPPPLSTLIFSPLNVTMNIPGNMIAFPATMADFITTQFLAPYIILDVATQNVTLVLGQPAVCMTECHFKPGDTVKSVFAPIIGLIFYLICLIGFLNVILRSYIKYALWLC